MNERIKELYTQSLETKFDYRGGEGVRPGEYYSNYKTVLNAEKFAELIVRECADLVKDFYQEDEFTCYSAAEEIKEHFGVRE